MTGSHRALSLPWKSPGLRPLVPHPHPWQPLSLCCLQFSLSQNVTESEPHSMWPFQTAASPESCALTFPPRLSVAESSFLGGSESHASVWLDQFVYPSPAEGRLGGFQFGANTQRAAVSIPGHA